MDTLNRGTSIGEGAHDRIHIVGPRLAEQILVSMKKNGTDVKVVQRVDFLPRTKFIVRTSWYRAKTSHRIEFEKWARLRRKEARLQDALHQRAPVGCKYIFPAVLFHGFIRGVFYIVSQYENALVPINEKTATTHALAGRMYRAVEETVHQLWRLGLAPMRVSPHTFALLPRARSAVVLNYNHIVVMNQPVRDNLMKLLSQYTGDVNPNACLVHNFKPGTLEHIWTMFQENTPIWNRLVDQYKSVFVKPFKEDESIDAYMKGLHAKMIHLVGARVTGQTASRGSVRRTILGGTIRGMLRGRRRARGSNDSNSRSPPLKIRKVATLPESNGWRSRKHSATWGVARTSNANANAANRVNRTRIESSRAISSVSPYASEYRKSSGGNDSENEYDKENATAPPRSEKFQNVKIGNMIGAQARVGTMLGPNAKESYNANYNVFTTGNDWGAWNQTRRNFVVKQETDKFANVTTLMKNVPEMRAILEYKATRNNKNSYNTSSATTKGQMRNIEFDAIMKSLMTNALKHGKYKNMNSGSAYIRKRIEDEVRTSWKLIDAVEKKKIINDYVMKFKGSSKYKELLASSALNAFVSADYTYMNSRVWAFVQPKTSIPANAKEMRLDNRIALYIADALKRGELFGMLDAREVGEYIAEQLKSDSASIAVNAVAFARRDRNRMVGVGFRKDIGKREKITSYFSGPGLSRP